MSDHKSCLECLCCEIACDVAGCECPEDHDCCKAAESAGLAESDFLSLIEVIAEIIFNLIDRCPANDAQLVEAVRKPRFMQRIGFRNQVYSSCRCCSNRRWQDESGKIADAAINHACDKDCCSDEKLLSVVFEVRNEDWMVI